MLSVMFERHRTRPAAATLALSSHRPVPLFFLPVRTSSASLLRRHQHCISAARQYLLICTALLFETSKMASSRKGANCPRSENIVTRYSYCSMHRDEIVGIIITVYAHIGQPNGMPLYLGVRLVWPSLLFWPICRLAGFAVLVSQPDVNRVMITTPARFCYCFTLPESYP